MSGIIDLELPLGQPDKLCDSIGCGGLQSPKSTSLNFDVEPKLTCSRPPALADGVRWRCSPKAICSSVNLRRNPGGILSLA